MQMKPAYRIIFPVIIALYIAFSVLLSKGFSYPFPQAKMPRLNDYAVFDLMSIAAGVRRLSADIAWIQLLQYYGSPEMELSKDTEYKLSWDMARYIFGMKVEPGEGEHKGPEDGHNDNESHMHYEPRLNGGTYSAFLNYSYRVVELDPFFYYAYLFGSGALAWNLNRPDEAIELLRYGITTIESYKFDLSRDPKHPFWQLNLYLSAIIYRKAGKFNDMISLLELAVTQPGCPNIVKAVLANIYQKEGNPAKSLKLWIDIFDSNDPTYQTRSSEKITELRKLLGI